MRVNYGQTVHGEEEIAAVVDVLRTSTQMGKRVRAMQERVAALFEKRHGIMVNSGSSANYLAVELLALPQGLRGDHAGADLRDDGRADRALRPGARFRGCGARHLNIDVDKIEAMITPKTRAMMSPRSSATFPIGTVSARSPMRMASW